LEALVPPEQLRPNFATVSNRARGGASLSGMPLANLNRPDPPKELAWLHNPQDRGYPLPTVPPLFLPNV